MSKPNHLARAAEIWEVLVASAGEGASITYGDLGKKIGVHHRPLRYAREPIQAFCMDEGLPPLTILVQSAEGKIGAGFIAWDRDRLAEGREEVFRTKWPRIENPFAPWREGETLSGLVREVIDEPARSSEVFGRVRVRGVQQQIFREALFELYDGACAMSGSSIAEGLEACHLLSWAEYSIKEAFSLQNGILLQSWYHRLLDQNLIDIDGDYFVRVPRELLDSASPADRDALRQIADQRVRLPAKRSHWPSVELLQRRRPD